MSESRSEVLVQPDAYHVLRDSSLLVAELHAALAICVHDYSQPVGGLLHLRYVATSNDRPLELTDNTLSSNLLLMDRFCKELRSAGARQHSWRVHIYGHTPTTPGMAGPAATVLDLAKAYFADGRLPVQCKETVAPVGLVVRLCAQQGRIQIAGMRGAAGAKFAAPVS